MRLCYISDPNSPHTRRWVGWFARHGHEVCLLADIPPKQAWGDYPIIDLSEIFHGRVIRFPVWSAWLRRYIRQWKPDILHAHRVNSAGWLVAASGFHPRVVTPWGSDVFVQPKHSRLARWLAKQTLSHADLVTTNSQAMSEQVIQLGARPETVQRVQFGVEVEIFHPGDTELRYSLRTKLALPRDRPLVLSARGIRPIYNIDVILQSMRGVRQSFPDATFLFIDYNTDTAYKNQLELAIREQGLEANTRWLPPTSSREEMADLYRVCDLVISVPSSDATPVSVLEAMACGVPVICSDLPSIHELIINGDTGYLVPVGDDVQLAKAIISLLEQPELATRMGQQACRVVSEKYNYELEMQKMEDCYKNLHGRQKR